MAWGTGLRALALCSCCNVPVPASATCIPAAAPALLATLRALSLSAASHSSQSGGTLQAGFPPSPQQPGPACSRPHAELHSDALLRAGPSEAISTRPHGSGPGMHAGAAPGRSGWEQRQQGMDASSFIASTSYGARGDAGLSASRLSLGPLATGPDVAALRPSQAPSAEATPARSDRRQQQDQLLSQHQQQQARGDPVASTSSLTQPSSPSASATPPSSTSPSQASSSAIVGVSTLQSGTGFKKTFYKRNLPTPPAIAFSSPEGRQLMQEALAEGTMGGFFKLVEQFSTQDEPAFCGLTSLSMVLNALSIDPRRIWKGAWRWFHEGMLDCCRPLEQVRKDGITLAQAAVLARCNGARVDMWRYGTFTEQEFRRHVEQACTTGEEHLIISYSRRAFGQTGDGHFSPIGGYHRARDLVLILDVARFKYPPHWVPLPMLYEAMARADPATGLPRGYMLLSAHHMLDSAMFTLDVRQAGWQAACGFAAAMPALLQQALAAQAGAAAPLPSPGQAAPPTAAPGKTAPPAPSPGPAVLSALCQLLRAVPLESAVMFVVVREQAVGPADRCVPHGARDALLAELRGLPLYQAVSEALTELDTAAALRSSQPSPADDAGSCSSGEAYLAERVTLLLLLQPPSAWPGAGSWGSEELAAQWQALVDLTGYSIVATEVEYLRLQFGHVEEAQHGGAVEVKCSAEACSHPHKLDCAAHGHAS